MKLGDIQLTTAQMQAFVRILDGEVKAEETRQAMADREKQEAAVYETRHERLTDLARQWARKNGPIEGMTPYSMAAATWELFTCGEGWFSEMDVDDYFSGDDDWQESWETAYISEISLIEMERHR